VRVDRPLAERSHGLDVELGDGFRFRLIERETDLNVFSFGHTIGHDCTGKGEGNVVIRARCSNCDKALPKLIAVRAPLKAAVLQLTYLAPLEAGSVSVEE